MPKKKVNPRRIPLAKSAINKNAIIQSLPRLRLCYAVVMLVGGSMIPLICVNRDKVMICETDGFFFYFPVLIKTKTNTRPVQSCTGRLAVRSVLVYRIPCSDSFGCVFACEAAEGYAAACGGTAHEVGIASCKVVAGAIADDIESVYGAAVGADGMQIVIDLDAVHRADEIPAALARSEEGGRVHGGQTVGFLAEVFVFTLRGKLVVALDCFHECVNRQIQLLGQLFNRIGPLDVTLSLNG